jgi:hypothetical protein
VKKVENAPDFREAHRFARHAGTSWFTPGINELGLAVANLRTLKGSLFFLRVHLKKHRKKLAIFSGK